MYYHYHYYYEYYYHYYDYYYDYNYSILYYTRLDYTITTHARYQYLLGPADCNHCNCDHELFQHLY